MSTPGYHLPYSLLGSSDQYQFSCSVVSDSLWPHGLQHARPPCPSPTPAVYPNSCPSSRWCHPTISSSVVSFSSRLQSFPASGSFQMSQFSASGGQSIGVSASTPVLPMNIQDWFPLGWTGWISLQSKGTLKSLLQYHQGIRSSNILILTHFGYTEISSPFSSLSVYITTHVFTSFLFIYWLWGMWDLSSSARDWTHILGIRNTES